MLGIVIDATTVQPLSQKPGGRRGICNNKITRLDLGDSRLDEPSSVVAFLSDILLSVSTINAWYGNMRTRQGEEYSRWWVNVAELLGVFALVRRENGGWVKMIQRRANDEDYIKAPLCKLFGGGHSQRCTFVSRQQSRPAKIWCIYSNSFCWVFIHTLWQFVPLCADFECVRIHHKVGTICLGDLAWHSFLLDRWVTPPAHLPRYCLYFQSILQNRSTYVYTLLSLLHNVRFITFSSPHIVRQSWFIE